MSSESICYLIANNKHIAELHLTGEEDGWHIGRVASEDFSPSLRKALAWYDEVVEGQMLSYLDQAVSSVDQFGIMIAFPGQDPRPVYSLHIDKDRQVSFRTTPVPKPAGCD